MLTSAATDEHRATAPPPYPLVGTADGPGAAGRQPAVFPSPAAEPVVRPAVCPPVPTAMTGWRP
jgi:hypothetical protein